MPHTFLPNTPYGELDRYHPELAVRSIVNTSVEEGVQHGIKPCDDAEVLTEALRREESGEKRASIIKPLKAKLKRLGGPVTPMAPEWDHARLLLDRIKLAIRLSLAGQVLLGLELQQLKTDLGFLGSGRRKKVAESATLTEQRTWKEWVNAELGLSDRTADVWIQLGLAAKSRVKKIGGGQKALGLISSNPAKLDDTQRENLSKLVDKLTDGSTQAELLEELKITKSTKAGNGGAKTIVEDKPDPTVEQLALPLFGTFQDSIIQLRTSSVFKKGIHALPLSSDDPDTPSLAVLEQQLGELLTEIEAAKKAQLKSLEV